VVRGEPGLGRVRSWKVAQTPGQRRRVRRYRLTGAMTGITAIIAYLFCDLDPRFVTFYDD
jgi:hypothetical protein